MGQPARRGSGSVAGEAGRRGQAGSDWDSRPRDVLGDRGIAESCSRISGDWNIGFGWCLRSHTYTGSVPGSGRETGMVWLHEDKTSPHV